MVLDFLFVESRHGGVWPLGFYYGRYGDDTYLSISPFMISHNLKILCYCRQDGNSQRPSVSSFTGAT